MRSVDGGLSWSPKVLVNHDAPAGYRETLPVLTVDDRGNVFASWWDQRETEGKGGEARFYDIYAAVSMDQGRTFSPGRRVTDASGINAGLESDAPAHPARGDRGVAAVYGRDLYVAWPDTRPSHVQSSGIDVYAARVRWAGLGDLPDISFPEPTLGDPTSCRISLESTGNMPLRITDVRSSLSNVHLQESLPIVVPPGGEAELTLMTDPLLIPEATGYVVVETNDSFAPPARIDFTVSGRSIVYALISDDFFEDPVLALGQQIPILVDMEDSVRVDSLAVYFREGGAAGHERLGMQRLDPPTPANDRYRAYIPKSSVGTRGVEFYVSAWNGALQVFHPGPEDPRHYRVRVPSLDLPSPPAGEYRMISFPIETAGARVYADMLADDLVGEPKKDWRLFALESSTPEGTVYRELDRDQDSPSRCGEAYWLITREGTPVDTGPVSGTSTPTDSAYVMVLDQAWNMIANPFNFPVAWESILVDGESMGAQNHVEPPRYYVSSEAGWNRENVDVLQPFEGYFVRKLVPEEVVLHIPPVEASPTPVALATASAADEDSWEIDITALSRGGLTVATAGVSMTGDEGWDREDLCQPPLPPSGGVSVCFPHDDWGYRSGGYSRDIRGMRDPVFPEEDPAPGHAWDFSLSATPGDGGPVGEVILGFAGVDRVPPHLGVVFVDRATGRVVDLRADPDHSVTLALTPETVPRFSLLVGDSTFLAEEVPGPAPRTSRLLAPFPNPFRGSAVIRYELAERGPARLVVFDVQGRQVHVLRDSVHESGVHEAVWRGDSDDGRPVPSGVYFYRLVADGLTRTRKLIKL